jgi:hypothetical protein
MPSVRYQISDIGFQGASWLLAHPGRSQISGNRHPTPEIKGQARQPVTDFRFLTSDL